MILRGTIYSETLKMDTRLTVVAPGNYHSDGPWDVAWLLHGLTASSESWVDNTLLPLYADEHRTIFILPEVGRSFYTDMKHGQRFFTWVADELPVVAQSFFNISADRAHTAVIGGSMGGYGALKLALSRPDRFGWCMALSPGSLFLRNYLDSQRKRGIVEIDGFDHIFGDNLECGPNDDLLELAKRAASQELRPILYTSCGTEDYLLGINQKFSREIRQLPFHYTYEELPGEHNWYFFDRALRRALEWRAHAMNDAGK